MNARGFIARLRAFVLRDRADAELDEELRFHLDAEVARNVAAGMSPDEARYAVLRAELDDGRELVYRDIRRIGKLLLK